jgi:hypothetical protein
MQTISLRKISFTITLFLGILFSNKIHANIIYVDSVAAGLNNGSSWADAYTDFQAGVNAANAGDTVWVALGTYYPPFNGSFSMKDSVAIYGGFAGTETNFSQRNLSLGYNSILIGNGYRVITNNNLSNSAALDGFTITGGNIIGTTGSGFTIPGSDVFGGGMYNKNASPTLSNLIFSNNQVTGGAGGINTGGGSAYGAGMYDSNSSPILFNITFNNNTALGGFGTGGAGGSGNGGGIYNINSSPILNAVTFTADFANGGNAHNGGIGGIGAGGGIFNNSSSPQLTNVTFSADSAKGATGATIASGYGGGMYNKSNSIPNLNTVYFYNNGAVGGSSTTIDAGSRAYGGGIYNDISSAILTNVIFSGNTAKGGNGGHGDAMGGGMYNNNCSPILINVQFLNNRAVAGFADISPAEGDGGGMYNNGSSPHLTNVTFSANQVYGSLGAEGSGYGGGAYNNNSSPILTNVTFSNNSANGATFPDFGIPSGGYGGGIYNTGSSPKLTNVTFFKNAAIGISFSYGGGIYNQSTSAAIITNCVFWSDTAKTAGNDIDNVSSTPIVTYSYTQTAIAGAGNIQSTIDPFIDSAHPAGIDGIFMTLDDGLHVLSTSAAYNGGINDSIPAGITTDITGTTVRILDGTVDMGAYETALATYTFTGSGNWSDANNWLGNQKPPATTLSGSQIVIDPGTGNECIVDISETVAAGAAVIVKSGDLKVPGDLIIQ